VLQYLGSSTGGRAGRSASCARHRSSHLPELVCSAVEGAASRSAGAEAPVPHRQCRAVPIPRARGRYAANAELIVLGRVGSSAEREAPAGHPVFGVQRPERPANNSVRCSSGATTSRVWRAATTLTPHRGAQGRPLGRLS
jgi:hypothetical protein